MLNFGIRGKLIFAFLSASILPLTFIGVYSYNRSSAAMEQQALSKVEAIGNTKAAALEAYFSQVKNQLLVMAHSEVTKAAMIRFADAFNSFQKDGRHTDTDVLASKMKLTKFYQDEFAVEFGKQNDGAKPDVQSVVNKLTPTQILLQNAYISSNSNPLGSKHLQDAGSGPESYNKIHDFYHKDFREFLGKFSYYDVFLVNAETGEVVYSVFKELDFTTSLKNGPYADSSLAAAYRGALELKDSEEIFMADYKTYFPSYNTPASFVSAPIRVGGEIKGVLIYQLPFDRVNAITLQKVTEDKTLETFLVGQDYHMRSDTMSDTGRTVKMTFKKPETGRIDNDDVRAALGGKKISSILTDYLGRNSLASAAPFNVFGQKWIIQTIITADEALAALVMIRWAIFIGLLVSAVLVASVALWYANSLSRKLIAVAEGLRNGANTVGHTSVEIADVSSRLSEASTEQASSLQETVASIDEISAMVQRNADSAASSLKTTEKSTVTAQDGKEKVEFMLDAINEISKENESIMQSIQKSNAEISEIVRVIREIADKTKVINDIVFQTKLLSFNASVEAARAGEHGKGFAVVAEEVGNLASMSGKAATEISDMLDKSVQQVNSIVEKTKAMMDGMVKSSKDKVDVGTRTAKECAVALDEILANVSTVNELVAEISTASQEQSTGVREITKAMAELDQVTQSNSSIANESASTASGLREQSERLTRFVEDLSFIVEGRVVDAPAKAPIAARHSAEVVSISKLKNEKKQKSEYKRATKKVVGLDSEAPNANDSRFEDV